MNMSERIKQLRLQNNMTQEELGKALNLKKSAIAKYETGRVENIKRPTIAKMAELFGVSPSYLIGMDAPVSEKDRRRAELYAQAKASDDPVLKGLINAIDKLLGIDE